MKRISKELKEIYKDLEKLKKLSSRTIIPYISYYTFWESLLIISNLAWSITFFTLAIFDKEDRFLAFIASSIFLTLFCYFMVTIEDKYKVKVNDKI